MESPKQTLLTAEVVRSGDELVRSLVSAADQAPALSRDDIEATLSWLYAGLWNQCERQLFERVRQRGRD